MSSSRTRGLRELRPDLFLGTRRRRALRDSSPPILLRFLGALVRRQGQDWRACCDELRGKLRAAAKLLDCSRRHVYDVLHKEAA